MHAENKTMNKNNRTMNKNTKTMNKNNKSSKKEVIANTNNKKKDKDSISPKEIERFFVIDRCLREEGPGYTWQDLGEVLKAEGHASSRRSVLGSIKDMKAFYNAPISCDKSNFYTYTDREYSIREKMLVDTVSDDYNKDLAYALTFLKQMEDFPLYPEIEKALTPLFTKYNIPDTLSVIGFDHQEVLGTNYFPDILDSIIQKKVISIVYQPYNKDDKTYTLSPYYLKQFNHRWYVFGQVPEDEKNESSAVITNLALDRIKKLNVANDQSFIENPGIDFKTYFDDIIGVTHIKNNKAANIWLQVNEDYRGYFETRPLHDKQKPQSTLGEDRLVHLPLCVNRELENKLFTLSSDVKILSPKWLQGKMIERLEKALDMQKKALEEGKTLLQNKKD